MSATCGCAAGRPWLCPAPPPAARSWGPPAPCHSRPWVVGPVSSLMRRIALGAQGSALTGLIWWLLLLPARGDGDLAAQVRHRHPTGLFHGDGEGLDRVHPHLGVDHDSAI